MSCFFLRIFPINMVIKGKKLISVAIVIQCSINYVIADTDVVM